MKILDTRVANNFSETYANLKEPPATLETERLKRNEYRARHGPLYHKFHARHGVHTDILKDSSTPWAKGVAAAGRSTNRGWVIRRYEGMQRVEGRTQSGLHFSCRGRPGSYWKYLHVIYGAHMLQEPNAPPCYPLLPSPPSSAHTLFHLSCKPLFRFFSSSAAYLFLFCGMAGSAVAPFPLFLFLSLISFIRSRIPPKPAGNVSRILQNVSRLSYCFRFLFADETTNTRMDWIFDGADPSGPSTHTLQSTHHLFPSRLRCSCI